VIFEFFGWFNLSNTFLDFFTSILFLANYGEI
jgi:hypothetical protein